MRPLAERAFVETILTDSIEQAAQILREGGLVAFPTETVYGLGADVFNESAVRRIFEAKERPADNPLIAHIGDIAQVSELAAETTEDARRLMKAFFPGPLTIVLKKFGRVPLAATAGLETIGVRMPGHALAAEFLKACGTPVVAPSANLSGRPSPTTWKAVHEDLYGRIDCILKGEPTDIGLESTVVDCTGDVPVVLRSGATPIEDLREVCPNIRESTAGDDRQARSPGTQHRHYSPKARVMIIANDGELEETASAAYIGIDLPLHAFRLTKICVDVADYAHSIFEFFRECDRIGIENIFCEAVPEEGLGTALMDRLRRSAER